MCFLDEHKQMLCFLSTQNEPGFNKGRRYCTSWLNYMWSNVFFIEWESGRKFCFVGSCCLSLHKIPETSGWKSVRSVFPNETNVIRVTVYMHAIQIINHLSQSDYKLNSIKLNQIRMVWMGCLHDAFLFPFIPLCPCKQLLLESDYIWTCCFCFVLTVQGTLFIYLFIYSFVIFILFLIQSIYLHLNVLSLKRI